MESNRRSLRTFQIRPVATRVILYRATETLDYVDPTLGWSRVHPHELDVIYVPGGTDMGSGSWPRPTSTRSDERSAASWRRESERTGARARTPRPGRTSVRLLLRAARLRLLLGGRKLVRVPSRSASSVNDCSTVCCRRLRRNSSRRASI